MARKMGLISIIIGTFWLISVIAALIFGLTYISGIENTALDPVDFMHNTVVESINVLHAIDFTNLLEKPINALKDALLSPLNNLESSIESFFTKIKLVYAGVITWLALPQILLIYTGWRLRRLGPKRPRRQRK